MTQMPQIWIRNRERNVSSPDLRHLRHLWLELFSRSRLSTRKESNALAWCGAVLRPARSRPSTARFRSRAPVRQLLGANNRTPIHFVRLVERDLGIRSGRGG